MKVEDLAGKINIGRLSHHTMLRFVDCKNFLPISNRMSIYNAYKYWGYFYVITFYIAYDEIENTITIDVFIDPDERR